MNNILIIHYNTPELTEALVKSINKNIDKCNIYIFDNSDKKPFINTFDNVTIFDNTKCEIINFNDILKKFPNSKNSWGKHSNYASFKHCISVDKCMDLINDNFILLDSDVLLKKNIEELFDDNYYSIGEVKDWSWGNGLHDKEYPIHKRILPFITFINVKKCKENGIRYYNPEFMDGLYESEPRNSSKEQIEKDSYDTGCWFFKAITGKPIKEIKWEDYVVHFGGGSYVSKGRNEKITQGEFLQKYKHLYTKNIAHNKVIYTVLIGEYDTLKEPRVISDGWDYICFTDNKNISSKNWNIRQLPKEIEQYDNKLKNKFLKFFPDLFLSEYDISILLDANLEIVGDLNNVIDKLDLNKYNMFFKTHPECNDIYTECDRCVKANRETKEVASLLKEKYSKEGMPKNYGLFECNFIVRKHNEDNVKHLMKLWWDEVNKISKRDQLSFTYLLWKHNLKDTIGVINFKDIENKVYKKHTHNKGIYSKPPTNENVKNDITNNLTLYRTYYLDTQFKSYHLDKDPNYVIPINTNDKKYQLSSKLNKYWSEYALMIEIAKEGKKTQYVGFDQFAQKLNISIIIDNPGYDIYFNKSMKNKVLKDQYNRFHCKDDMDNVISILNELYGNGNKYTNALTNKTTFYYESCFIMKWEIFNEFCNFLFEILDKLDKKYKLEYKPENYKEFFSNPSRKYGYSYSIKPGYQDRAFGFLSERLLSIFISENYKNTTLVLNEPRTINTSTVIKDRDTEKNNITEKKIVVIDKETIRTTNTFRPKRTTQKKCVHFLRKGINW